MDRIVTVEHHVDDAERHVIATIFAPGILDLREAYVVSQIAHNLETAADAIARSALMLRDHVLGEVMVGR